MNILADLKQRGLIHQKTFAFEPPAAEKIPELKQAVEQIVELEQEKETQGAPASEIQRILPADKVLTLYCGFDPTADSLHVGHLMGQLMLRRFQLAGNHPIALAGGATGQIGDPSGKASERQLLTRDQIQHNVESIKRQLSRILDFDSKTNPARLVDNADWTAPIPLLDFLRDIGKHFSVNVMMQKESVRARMEDREAGISFTEFSYMLLRSEERRVG